ncbi:sugar ABC transporter ATP-binding protein [Pseudomonas chlororaphis subsp. aurantiaca]|uniref:ABC transporter ATP-binding protein n=1 Tax=Pseudomonas chlororaphis TaxID=587753 RepID=UPI00050D56CA|nr:ABC transporter ATP-binding protein [Pseudomonas chlororaphis]AIS11883.1 sugar ABC transporter ATP-binding protein [Pseudomonas chlororaphis subsp. aurantiaca]
MSYILAKSITVDYPILDLSRRSFKKDALSWVTGGRVGEDSKRHLSIRALDQVDLEISSGEKIGLLGHNGSGKSTLLKVMAEVYWPTSGVLKSSGRITSLLDLTLGMELEATGYENIFLRGAILGVKPKEIKQVVSDIAEFSGLGDYLRLPIRTYSSGMLVRLGFSISTAFPADIILMDEWLGVGDAQFQSEANQRLEKMTENAAILVLASHSPDLINKVCGRCIKLEHGKVVNDFLVGGET